MYKIGSEAEFCWVCLSCQVESLGEGKSLSHKTGLCVLAVDEPVGCRCVP